MSDIRIIDPKTGRTGSVSVEDLSAATKDGLQPLDPIRIYDPQSGKSGEVDPEHAAQALGSGLVPEGSRAHKVATTGYGESALRGAAQGASLGFADELTGVLESLFTDKSYQQARDESRENYDIARQANPKMTLAGELGGGVASAFLPGMHLAKGASLGREILLGGKLGAAAGLGNSRADLTQGDIGGALKDTLHGAELGAGGGAVFGLGSRALQAGSNAVGRVARDALDPTEQYLRAVGATKKNFMGPLGDRSERAVDVFQKLGLFDKLPDGSYPDLEDLARVSEAHRQEAAQGLQNLFAQHGDKSLDLSQLGQDIIPQLRQIVDSAPPDMRAGLSNSMRNLWQDVADTGGSLQGLWALKKRTGGWTGPAWDKAGQAPPLKEAFMKVNQTLEGVLENATSQYAEQHGLQTMRELNDVYGATATLGKVMEDKLARNSMKDPLNVRIRDGSILSAAGGALGFAAGGGVGGAIGAGLGGVAGQALNSTPGHLMRAKIGQMMHIGQQAQAVTMGAMPRTTPGIIQYVQQNFQRLAAMAPQQVPLMQQLAGAPPEKAEMMIRAALPMLTPLLAPSPFPSEIDGKVSAPQDRMLATTMLEKVGLQPSELAREQSKLNRDGTLSAYIWTQQKRDNGGDTVADELESLNKRLNSMGY